VALHENGRESITITVKEVSPFAVGALIALFERAVGLYATLINVNAYHQPGVEAGKKAATTIIDLQLRIIDFLSKQSPKSFDPSQIAQAIGQGEEIEAVFKICEHLAANPDRGVQKSAGALAFDAEYCK
jgi:glucose-6-phosphate isomerase